MPHQQCGTIQQALDQVSSNNYVLPAIQHDLVWQPKQICALLDSVMQGYPFGEFLFWRVEVKNVNNYSYYGFIRD